MKTNKTYDKISIRDLSLRMLIGINPEEKIRKQEVFVSIDLYTDISKAAASDAIADTLDYDALHRRILERFEDDAIGLIEKLIEQIAAMCLEDERVAGCRVVVDKPAALAFARCVAVEIERWR